MIYPYRCDCGHSFEVSRSMKDTPPESVPCPVCTAPCGQDFAAKRINRPKEWRGQAGESLWETYPKHEVPRAREIMGDKFGAAIQDDGTVRHQSSADATAYCKHYKAIAKQANEVRAINESRVANEGN